MLLMDDPRVAAEVQGHVGVVLGTVMTAPEPVEFQGSKIAVWCQQTCVLQFEPRWVNVVGEGGRVIGRAVEISLVHWAMMSARIHSASPPVRIEVVDTKARRVYVTYIDEIEANATRVHSLFVGPAIRIMEDDLDLEAVGRMNDGVMVRQLIGVGAWPQSCGWPKCKQSKLQGVLVDVETRTRKGACVKHWAAALAISGWIVEQQYDLIRERDEAKRNKIR